MKRIIYIFISYVFFVNTAIFSGPQVFDVDAQAWVGIPVILSSANAVVAFDAPKVSQEFDLGGQVFLKGDYPYISYRIEGIRNGPVLTKIKVQDQNQKWWAYPQVFLVENEGVIQVPLSGGEWNQDELVRDKEGLIQIQKVKILVEGSSLRFRSSTFNIGYTSLETQFNPQALLPQDRLYVFAADTQPPVISLMEIDGALRVENEMLSERPVITATLQDTESGLATWNIQILNARTSAIVQESSGHGNGQVVPVLIQFAATEALVQGDFMVRIVAKDLEGNTVTQNSETVSRETAFSLKEVLNSPNPFNPTYESTQINYLLSRSAQVSIWIYAIDGTLEKKCEFPAGSEGARVGYNRILWDGKNDFGDALANGIYIAYVVAKVDGETKKGKVKIWIKK